MQPMGEDPMPILRFDPTHLTTSKSPNVVVLVEENVDAQCTTVTRICEYVVTVVQHTTKAHEARSIPANQHEIRNNTRIQKLENDLFVNNRQRFGLNRNGPRNHGLMV